MEYLMTHLVHPTADEIFNSLNPQIPTLSKTTVYNTLNLFAGEGAIAALAIDGKNARYDADISEHAHFRCTRCGAVMDLRLKHTASVEVENPDNLRIEGCEVYFRGLCNKCSQTE
jgi:Fur family ferric uptake transcriptional regulator/Fur family peroxide stress response transcriptional regulator